MGGLRTVQNLIDDNYLSFTDSCMRRAGGDQQKADYLFDCSYFEYYWQIATYNRWVEAENERIKEATKK